MLALFRDFSWVYLLCLHAVLDALLINKVYFLLLPMYVIIGLNWHVKGHNDLGLIGNRVYLLSLLVS